ncbi:hypothetical protein [uncultured Paraglaciecola sp.]|nr:hypothetical protein [uncultured Paraglaciecola sp.]
MKQKLLFISPVLPAYDKGKWDKLNIMLGEKGGVKIIVKQSDE